MHVSCLFEQNVGHDLNIYAHKDINGGDTIFYFIVVQCKNSKNY